MPKKMHELNEAQRKVLHLLCICRRLGPHPTEYQGDYVHIDRLGLVELIEWKMVGCKKLAHPRDWTGNAPYFRVSHMYRILKAGRISVKELTDNAKENA